MRPCALFVLAIVGGAAGGQGVGPADVVRVERIYYLADGRAVVIEETSDRPGTLESVPVPRKAVAVESVGVPRRVEVLDRAAVESVEVPAPRYAGERSAAVQSVPVIVPRQPAPPARTSTRPAEVRAPDPFRGQPGKVYNASHTCPRCGYTSPSGSGTWIKRGTNADGTHNHQCPKCGAAWYH